MLLDDFLEAIPAAALGSSTHLGWIGCFLEDKACQSGEENIYYGNSTGSRSPLQFNSRAFLQATAKSIIMSSEKTVLAAIRGWMVGRLSEWTAEDFRLAVEADVDLWQLMSDDQKSWVLTMARDARASVTKFRDQITAENVVKWIRAEAEDFEKKRPRTPEGAKMINEYYRIVSYIDNSPLEGGVSKPFDWLGRNLSEIMAQLEGRAGREG